MGFGECRGAKSLAAKDCSCFQLPGGQPRFLDESESIKQMSIF